MAVPLSFDLRGARPVRRWARRGVAALSDWAVLLLRLKRWVIHRGGAPHG